MKKFYLLFLSIMLGFASQAQDYKIDFTASGVSNIVLDSVKVVQFDSQPMFQQTVLMLDGTDTLHLYGSVGINKEQQKKDKIRFYPNPLKDGKGTLSFYQHQAAETDIEIYNMQGKLMLSKQLYLQQGQNEFSVKGMPSGFFMISVKTSSFSGSMKLISIDGKRGAPELEFMQNTPGSTSKAAVQSTKTLKGLIGMQYNDGESLKLIGYANNDSCTYFYIPDKSQKIDFVFATSYPPGTTHCGTDRPAALVEVTNSTTGETWMDRNLGAAQQAKSSTDSLAYGDLYQWGRFSDGHQYRNSGTIYFPATNDTPLHYYFINSNSDPYDWLQTQNNNLWEEVNGVNNPCPNGYRLPTKNELNTERQSWSSNDATGAYNSPLKLPVTGYRDHSSGLFNLVGSVGVYWTSTIDGSNTSNLYFSSILARMESYYRANGLSVRCIKD